MNNEVLEKIEKYNNGGLLNEPTTFSNNISMDATTLVNLFTSSTGTGFGSFSLSFPKEKTVELSAVHTVSTPLVRNDPTGVENYIRSALARKLAQQLIEEDLIQIQACEDIEHMNTTFCAKVKVVQE